MLCWKKSLELTTGKDIQATLGRSIQDKLLHWTSEPSNSNCIRRCKLLHEHLYCWITILPRKQWNKFMYIERRCCFTVSVNTLMKHVPTHLKGQNKKDDKDLFSHHYIFLWTKDLIKPVPKDLCVCFRPLWNRRIFAHTIKAYYKTAT